jgi:hypothetical protein
MKMERKQRQITWAYAQGSLPQVIGKINRPVKGGKDHIFLRLDLLRSPYSAQKNVAYARTLCAIVSLLFEEMNGGHPWPPKTKDLRRNNEYQ